MAWGTEGGTLEAQPPPPCRPPPRAQRAPEPLRPGRLTSQASWRRYCSGTYSRVRPVRPGEGPAEHALAPAGPAHNAPGRQGRGHLPLTEPCSASALPALRALTGTGHQASSRRGGPPWPGFGLRPRLCTHTWLPEAPGARVLLGLRRQGSSVQSGEGRRCPQNRRRSWEQRAGLGFGQTGPWAAEGRVSGPEDTGKAGVWAVGQGLDPEVEAPGPPDGPSLMSAHLLLQVPPSFLMGTRRPSPAPAVGWPCRVARQGSGEEKRRPSRQIAECGQRAAWGWGSGQSEEDGAGRVCALSPPGPRLACSGVCV